MNWAMRLPKSCISGLRREGSNLRVRFDPALLHCAAEGRTTSPTDAWLQPAELVFREAVLAGSEGSSGPVVAGALRILGTPLSELPAPFSACGGVGADFACADGSSFSVKAVSVELRLLGEPAMVSADTDAVAEPAGGDLSLPS